MQYQPNEAGDKVALFADTYCNHHESSTGIAAVRLLDAMGYHVLLADTGCCQRPRISNGFLKDAKKDGLKTIHGLSTFFDTGIPVLTLEPSCATALTVDLPDLIEDELIGKQAKDNIIPIESFVVQNLDRMDLTKMSVPSKEIFLHGHCHQKAIFGTQSIHRIFHHLGVTVTEPDSGCCGMAGAFGYEKEHYELSKKIGERVLVKAINKTRPDIPIAASGFSCRHQIHDMTERKPVHWVAADSDNAPVCCFVGPHSSHAAMKCLQEQLGHQQEGSRHQVQWFSVGTPASLEQLQQDWPDHAQWLQHSNQNTTNNSFRSVASDVDVNNTMAMDDVDGSERSSASKRGTENGTGLWFNNGSHCYAHNNNNLQHEPSAEFCGLTPPPPSKRACRVSSSSLNEIHHNGHFEYSNDATTATVSMME